MDGLASLLMGAHCILGNGYCCVEREGRGLCRTWICTREGCGTSKVSRKLCNFFIVLAASVGFNETRSSGLYMFDNHHVHEKHFRRR